MISKENILFNLQNKDKMVRHLRAHGFHGDFENPKTISEVMQWLNIYDANPLKSKCGDKILLREYAKEVLGEDICVPLIKTWDSAKDVDFSILPNRFIIKCNHGSAMNCTILDKSKMNENEVRAKLDKWMNTDFAFTVGFESYYHWIERKVLAEEYIGPEDGSGILDYKMICFNGKPKYLQVISGRQQHKIRINYYDMDLNKCLTLSRAGFWADYSKDDVLPTKFDKMKEYAAKLAAPFAFVRVDFYEIDGRIYLGEMTFTPGACMVRYKDPNDDVRMGSMVDLSKIKEEIKDFDL